MSITRRVVPVSGTVRDIPIKGPHHLAAGDKFTVGMKQWGVPYKVTSTATETFDYTTDKAAALLELLGMHRQNADGITSTLERLAARFGG
jgi:hypothetical protein